MRTPGRDPRLDRLHDLALRSRATARRWLQRSVRGAAAVLVPRARLATAALLRGRRLERAFFVVAVILLGYCGLTLLDAQVYDLVQERRLESFHPRPATAPAASLAALRRAASDSAGSATAEEPVAPAPTTPWRAALTREEAGEDGLVGRIEIARVGVHAIVAEGVSARDLRRAVGHIPGTAFPGELGNVGIAGHRDRHFRGLRNVATGDRISVETPDGVFEYVVDRTEIVEPDATQVIAPTPDARLTLVTCYPFWYLGHAPQRFIVHARLASEPAALAAAAATPEIPAR